MIWERFQQRVDLAPDRTAVVWRGTSISFASLAGMVESLAAEIPAPEASGENHGRPEGQGRPDQHDEAGR